MLMWLGIVPTLAVRGRTSGEWLTVPVNVLEFAGERYLMAPGGDAQWVRNLRATGRGELRWCRGTEPFRSTEIADDERPRIIEALSRAPGLPGAALLQGSAEGGRSPGLQDRAPVTERRSRSDFAGAEHSGMWQEDVDVPPVEPR
jgi:hypothetical protein